MLLGKYHISKNICRKWRKPYFLAIFLGNLYSNIA
jgi:hypothetical protein